MTSIPASEFRGQCIAASRALAATSLVHAIDDVSAARNEVDIHARWHAELAAQATLMPHGWYMPPPEGMSVLIGQPPDFLRTTFASLRAPEKWPSAKPKLARDSLLFCYCSPVHRQTAMIGDFQLTLYGGTDHRVRDHLVRCLDITIGTAEYAAIGMTFGEVYADALQRIQQAGLDHTTRSTTGPSEKNIGHSIPWSDGRYDDRIWASLSENRSADIAQLISNARVFVTASQSQMIAPDMAFTIEPQITSPLGLFASYHVIVSFVGGIKRILTNFLEPFDMFGMRDYLPSELLDRLTQHETNGQSRLDH